MPFFDSLFDSSDPAGFYKVAITGETLWPDVIMAYTPETFSLTTQANFESRLGAGLNRFVPGADTFQAATGLSLVTKKMTLMTWQSSNPIEFSLPLLFNAKRDPLAEVHRPLTKLLAMTLPRASDTPLSGVASALGSAANSLGSALSGSVSSLTGQNLLRGPGPTFAEPDRGAYYLTIGNIAIFKDMVITSVQVEMDSLVTNQGQLISAKADVTVRSATVYLQEDMMQAFMMGGLF